MRLAFAYRYGALGGVPTQLINRMQYLSGLPDLEVDFIFGQDYGIAPFLAPFGDVVFEPDGRKVARIAEARAYDVVAVFDTEEYLEGLSGGPAAVLLEVHTTVEFGLRYLERRWSPAAWVVPSEYSRCLLRDRFGVGRKNERVHVVPNIIDPSMFHPLPDRGGAARPIVVWVGRIDDHKNWQGFLEIASLLFMSRPDLEYWMIGGETAPESTSSWMLETVEGLGLMHRFRWFPKIEYAQMPCIYGRVAESGGCALVTSRDESFGMSVAEALLSGCPVVSSDVGAIGEIAPAASYLSRYPFGDLEAASEQVLAFVREPEGVRRALGADMADLSRRFSPATIGPRYAEIVRALAAERTAAAVRGA